jgi:hypothetical protein
MSLVCAAHAESMEQCMNKKVDALRDKKTETVISDRGCTSGGTEFVLKFDYQGFKTSECSENVCWPAPPGRAILDAVASDASAAGSRHSFSGPNYMPTREQPIQVCFPVYARSPDRDIGARGWQNINVSVTHEKLFSTTEMTGLAVACAREGAN